MALPAVARADAGPEDRQGGRRIREQFERALSNEEAIGRRFSTGALLIGIGVISIWLFIQVELSRVWYYQAILGAFGLLVLANYLVGTNPLGPSLADLRVPGLLSRAAGRGDHPA